MGSLKQAIHTIPIIDHHAHNLLLAANIQNRNRLSIFTEANGSALEDSTSSLAFQRGVRQLSCVLGCENTWDAVEQAILAKHRGSSDEWAKECFSGIETLLIDDGLDPSDVHPYSWHDRLVRSKCRRIVRIERIAERHIQTGIRNRLSLDERYMTDIAKHFESDIEAAITDPQVAGFKSVICYRTGLRITPYREPDAGELGSISGDSDSQKAFRLEHESLNPFFVHLTARVLQRLKCKKPFQFHTGLGDNDINLYLSNPAHLQPFIETYPEVNIVLLHASYPFTKEAGYLATVFKNVYMDIGEVFPFLSKDGQESVIRESLDLCPSTKLLWSTDGHWFPETYLLAVMQIREGLEKVLTEYVDSRALTAEQASKIVEDLFFNTANELYDLGLKAVPLDSSAQLSLSKSAPAEPTAQDVGRLGHFLDRNPSVKFLRLQWVDYTATARVRLLPVKQALNMVRDAKYIGITKAVLGLLQIDATCEGFSATGEYDLVPIWSSLRISNRPQFATLQCEFRERDGTEVNICPRTVLRRQIERAKARGLSLLTGFEIEVVFMTRKWTEDHIVFGDSPTTSEGGHAWSAVRALHDHGILNLIESIAIGLERAGIELQQFHAEAAPGQYEFVLGPLPPLEAVDTLLAARDIITQAAADANLRATLYPKPLPGTCGTGAHIHLSLQPPNKWQHFYAGVLDTLPGLSALTYPNEASYERVVDGVWAGSTWVAWGPQNRETPLRQIEDSHFEIKCVDGLANPYLCLAGIVGAGLQGIEDGRQLEMSPCLADPAVLSESERSDLGIIKQFPKGIGEALERFGSSEVLRKALGQEFVDTYLRVKTAEGRMLRDMEPDRRRNWLIERY